MCFCGFCLGFFGATQGGDVGLHARSEGQDHRHLFKVLKGTYWSFFFKVAKWVKNTGYPKKVNKQTGLVNSEESKSIFHPLRAFDLSFWALPSKKLLSGAEQIASTGNDGSAACRCYDDCLGSSSFSHAADDVDRMLFQAKGTYSRGCAGQKLGTEKHSGLVTKDVPHKQILSLSSTIFFLQTGFQKQLRNRKNRLNPLKEPQNQFRRCFILKPFVSR